MRCRSTTVSVSCRCMRASGLLPTVASSATRLAGRGSHRRGVRRRPAPGIVAATRPRQPRSSGMSGAVPFPGDVRCGRAGRPCPRAGRQPGMLPGRPSQPAQGRPFVSAPEPKVEHDTGPQPQRLKGDRDEPAFEHPALAAGHRIAEQRDHPVIRGQPQRLVRRGEFCGPGGFPAAGSPTIRISVAARGFCVTGSSCGRAGNGCQHGEPEWCDGDMTPLIRQRWPGSTGIRE